MDPAQNMKMEGSGMGAGMFTGSIAVNMTETEGYGLGRLGERTATAALALGGPLIGGAPAIMAGVAPPLNHPPLPPLYLHIVPLRRLFSHRGVQGGWGLGWEGKPGAGWREGPRRPFK
jgi:hypothetical protein